MAVHYALPGNEASTVAAFTIVSRITLFCFAIVIGFGQGFQPVCGYNYGAKLYARVKESYMFCITITTAFLIVLGTMVYIFAPSHGSVAKTPSSSAWVVRPCAGSASPSR